MFLNPVYVICSLTGQTKVLFTATEIVFVLQIKFNWLLAFFTVSVSFEVDREGGRERNIITPLPRHRFEISRGLIFFFFLFPFFQPSQLQIRFCKRSLRLEQKGRDGLSAIVRASFFLRREKKVWVREPSRIKREVGVTDQPRKSIHQSTKWMLLFWKSRLQRQAHQINYNLNE